MFAIKMILRLSILFLLVNIFCIAGARQGISTASASEKLFKKGINLLESGETKLVPELAKEIANKEPDQYHHLMSLYHFYSGDYVQALNEIKKTNINENRVGLFRYLERLTEITKGFDEYEFTNYRLRLNKSDLVLKPYLEKVLEKIYSTIGKEFNYFPEDKIIIEIYPTREEFSFASTLGEKTVERSGAIGICKFNRIMITSPRVLPYGYRWMDTICHEYVHFVVNRVTKNNCSLWFHEGMARYFETSWRLNPPEYITPGSINRLLKARDESKLISFSRMSPSLVYLKNQDEVSLAFSEVSSAVDFLNQKHKGKLPLILQALAVKPRDKAFRSVLGMNMKKFESAWKKYLQTLTLTESAGAVQDKIYWQKIDEIDAFVGIGLRDHIRLGDKFRKMGKYPAAAAQYEKALKKEPYNPVVLLRYAKALLGLGKNDSAIEKLKLAIEKNPNYVSAYEILVQYYFSQEQYDQVIKFANESIAINPYNPNIHRILGNIYLKLKKLDLAYLELNNTLLLQPEDFLLRKIISDISLQH